MPESFYEAKEKFNIAGRGIVFTGEKYADFNKKLGDYVNIAFKGEIKRYKILGFESFIKLVDPPKISNNFGVLVKPCPKESIDGI